MIDIITRLERKGKAPDRYAAVCGKRGVGSMVSRRVTVAHPQGLHMRPAQLLVSAMGRHPCEVTILAEGRRINGKSILSILSACIRQGSEIELICSGAGERAALEEAAALIQSRENGE